MKIVLPKWQKVCVNRKENEIVPKNVQCTMINGACFEYGTNVSTLYGSDLS